jgi:hypothetical protein
MVIAAITLVALVVALVVVNKEGLRKFQWELTADKIIQRYEWWPTIEIRNGPMDFLRDPICLSDSGSA